MGFNIAGLVIDQNYEKDINKLNQDLGWNLEIIEAIDFETASANWTPEDEFRLHFTDQATMIFFAHEWVAEGYHSKTANTLNYAYSATAMAFQVDLYNEGQLVRSITEHNGDKHYEQGQTLKLEEENSTADGLTFALFDELLGEPFGSIDFSAQSYRCKMVQDRKESATENKEVVKPEETKQKEEVKTTIPKEVSLSPKLDKKWWEFWK